jgi:hypothetical protein
MIKLKDILKEAKGDELHPDTFNNEKAVEKMFYKEWIPWTTKEKRGAKIVYKLAMWNVGYYHLKNKTLIWNPQSARPKDEDCEENLKEMHLNTKYAKC